MTHEFVTCFSTLYSLKCLLIVLIIIICSFGQLRFDFSRNFALILGVEMNFNILHFLCSFMALRQKLWLWENLNSYLMYSRFYSTKIDWDKLRPMILKRIKERAKDYPVRRMVPVAYDVLNARALLVEGVSALLYTIPIKACK